MKPLTTDGLDELELKAKAGREKWTGSDATVSGSGTACYVRTSNLEYHPAKKIELESSELSRLIAMARDSLSKDAEIARLKAKLGGGSDG